MAGFRVAKQSGASTKGIARMEAKQHIDIKRLHLVSSIFYAFFNVNSSNGAAIDVGIYKMDSTWRAFIQGDNGNIWITEVLSDSVFANTNSFYMVAEFDSEKGITLTFAGNKVLNCPTSKHWMINELCHSTGIHHTGFENTLVPVNADWTNFNKKAYWALTEEEQKAFIGNAGMKKCKAFDRNQTLLSFGDTFVEADGDSTINYSNEAKACTSFKNYADGFALSWIDLSDTNTSFAN